jgi:hypothetical protein
MPHTEDGKQWGKRVKPKLEREAARDKKRTIEREAARDKKRTIALAEDPRPESTMVGGGGVSSSRCLDDRHGVPLLKRSVIRR